MKWQHARALLESHRYRVGVALEDIIDVLRDIEGDTVRGCSLAMDGGPEDEAIEASTAARVDELRRIRRVLAEAAELIDEIEGV